jgi:hypothetical protein
VGLAAAVGAGVSAGGVEHAAIITATAHATNTVTVSLRYNPLFIKKAYSTSPLREAPVRIHGADLARNGPFSIADQLGQELASDAILQMAV